MAAHEPSSIRQELGRLLPIAAIGVAFGIAAAWVVLPQPVEPIDAPMPTIDWRALEPSIAEDRRARAEVEEAPLPAEIRAIASAYYAWNVAGAEAPPVGDVNVPENPVRQHLLEELRAAIGVARQRLGDAQTLAKMRTLRSYDAERFLDELARAGSEPQRAQELRRLSGALVDVLLRNGWTGASLEPRVPRAILRIRYKLHWTSVVYGLGDCDREGAEVCYGLTTLPLDPVEVRTLLAFLIAHPVVRPDELARAGNRGAAADARRLVYLDRLAALDRFADPSGDKRPYLGACDYPLARGAMLFGAGRFLEAEQTLRVVANARANDGRARNWYMAAWERNHPTP